MTDNVEVLVHISTSATRQNDEMYRSLAHAYTRFDSVQTHRDQSRKRVRANPNAVLPRAVAPNYSTPSHDISDPVLVASKDSYGSFPSNLSSNSRQQDYNFNLDESLRNNSRLAQLDRSYQSWRKRATPLKDSRQGRKDPRSCSDDYEDADTGFIEDSQSALQAVQSQLEDAYSTTSADTSDDDRPEEAAFTGCEQVPDVSVASIKKMRTIANDIPPLALLGESAREDIEPSPQEESPLIFQDHTEIWQEGSDSAVDQIDFSELPLDAFPPPTAISVERPGTLPSQITRHLAVIKTRNPGRFKPLRILRDLELDERGYWRIDCTHWSLRLQQDFWLSLHEHVCSGRIGWGTTLHRESTSRYMLGVARLYCWGEVVEHFWLILWLCSKGEIAHSGLKWIDADGVAIVQMR